MENITSMKALLLLDAYGKILFYDDRTGTVTKEPVDMKELREVLSRKDVDDIEEGEIHRNIPLPSYDEIDHKGIMSFYVKEFVEDKEIRKQLFYILRRDSYVKDFVNKLKEYNLFDDYEATCGSIYDQIISEWAKENNLTLGKKE